MAKMLNNANHVRWCDCKCPYHGRDWACPDSKTSRTREKRKWKRDHGLL